MKPGKISVFNNVTGLEREFIGRNVLFVGALSFEERCLGALKEMKKAGLGVEDALFLEYPTQAFPVAEDRKLRAKHKNIIENEFGATIRGKLEFETIFSNSFSDFQTLITATLETSRADFVIYDITCFSKIHTLALAHEVSRKHEKSKCSITYTIPENYQAGTFIGEFSGWKDIIISPLAETAYFFNEAHGRGLIILGHDADRLVVALAEIEPSGGSIVIPDTPNRPDLRDRCRITNRKIIKQLTSLRMSFWSSELVSLADFSGLETIIQKEVKQSIEHDAPIILFPFGPKSLIFYSGLSLCTFYPQGAWFVYPIPLMYDVGYSVGIEATIWLAGAA